MSVTIKDIARIAGVSVATVSKALNNSPLVKPSTKLKISQIAEQMGYQPNIAAKSLVSKKSRTIGAVWPNVDRATLSTLATKINQELNQCGYSMLLSINPAESAIQLFNQIQVDAILVFDRSDPTSYAGPYTSKVPVLCYGEPASKGFPSVYVDRRKAIFNAVQYLWGLGHKRITYIGDVSNRRISQQEKYLGFTDGIIEFGLPTHPKMTVNSNGLDSHEGYITAKQLLASSYKPTAIISGSYDLSVGILRALQEENIRIPQDISLVSYDNIPQMDKLPVPLTAVGGPIDIIAKKVVESILLMIETQEQLPLIQTVEPEIIERDSCRPPVSE
ncbi:LacI family DNA-binding transcriptional regulator [Paenibacillus piri]|uniref:LacI family transcriptional regulator n=1 Tax=Paenibacillus piri TaxID=2547395 RepID=A0A4R5KKM7_9BACL|nr:LacI family DNA-binding transcriptional regulator [Paenibacillus piri]TDF95388.1 LacI family transcriptional regulator [Paenibacillus piri]